MAKVYVNMHFCELTEFCSVTMVHFPFLNRSGTSVYKIHDGLWLWLGKVEHNKSVAPVQGSNRVDAV